MKKGWTYKKFKEICYSISDGDWIEKKDQSNSGIRLIQTGNIGVGKFIPKSDSKKYISEDTFKRLRCTEIVQGDILISRLPNPLGRSCMLPQMPTRCITAVDCSILKINSEIVIPQFFIYYTQSGGYFSKIDNESSGTTRARITRKKLEETLIPLPSLSEQKRIVSRLDAAFAHIDELKANAEKQLSEARALFQKALEKAMEPKEGWEEKTIEHFAKIVHGKNQKEVLDSNGSYPIYGSGGNIMGYANAYLCDAGTTILGRKGTIDNPLYINEKFWNVDTAFGIIAKNNCNKKFLYYSIKNIDWAKLNTGTTLPSLTQNVVYNVGMCAPPLSEQRRIVARLDSLSAHVRELEVINKKLIAECDALKQALLRKVFD